MKTPLLYSYFRSSCAYRVRLALIYKGIDYDYRAVHLLKDGGEQRKADYLKLNPHAQVPYLFDSEKNFGIAQSVAILLYLDSRWPERSLFPKDQAEVASMLEICELVNSGIQPIHNLKVLQQLESRFSATQAQKTEWSKFFISEGLRAIEEKIQKRASTYFWGKTPTAVDCFLIPLGFTAERNEVDLKAFPTFAQTYARLIETPEVKKAHPSNQPDSE